MATLVCVGVLLLVGVWVGRQLPQWAVGKQYKQQIIASLVQVLETQACPYAKPATCTVSVRDISADWQWPSIWVAADTITVTGPVYKSQPGEGDEVPKPASDTLYPAKDFLTLAQAKVWLGPWSLLRGGKVTIKDVLVNNAVLDTTSLLAGPPLTVPEQEPQQETLVDMDRIPVRLDRVTAQLKGAPTIALKGATVLQPDKLAITQLVATVVPTKAFHNASFSAADMGYIEASGALALEDSPTFQALAVTLGELELDGVTRWVQAFMPADASPLLKHGSTHGALHGMVTLEGPMDSPGVTGNVAVKGVAVHNPAGSRIVVLDNTTATFTGQQVNVASLGGVVLGQGFSAQVNANNVSNPSPVTATVKLDASNVALSELRNRFVSDIAPYLPDQSAHSIPMVTGSSDIHLTLGIDGQRLTPNGNIILNQVGVVEPSVAGAVEANATAPVPTVSATVAVSPAAIQVSDGVVQLPARQHSGAGGELRLSATVSDWWHGQQAINPHAQLALTTRWHQVAVGQLLDTVASYNPTMPPPAVELRGVVNGEVGVNTLLAHVLEGNMAAVLPNVVGTLTSEKLQVVDKRPNTLPTTGDPDDITAMDASVTLAQGQLAIAADKLWVNGDALAQNLVANVPLAALMAGGPLPINALNAAVCTTPIPLEGVPELLATLNRWQQRLAPGAPLLQLPNPLPAMLADASGLAAASMDWHMGASGSSELITRLAITHGEIPLVDTTTHHTLGTLTELNTSVAFAYTPSTQVLTASLNNFNSHLFTADQRRFTVDASIAADFLATGAVDSTGLVVPTGVQSGSWRGRLTLQPGKNTSALPELKDESDDLATATLTTQGALKADGHIDITDTQLDFGDMGTIAMTAYVRPPSKRTTGVGSPPNWDINLSTGDTPLQLDNLTAHWLAPWVPAASPLYGDNILYQPGGGQLAVNVRVAGHEKDDTMVVGNLTLQDLNLPLLSIRDADMAIDFTGVDSQLTLAHMALPGVEVDHITAHITDTLLYPFHLENVGGHANLFVLKGWERWIARDITDRLTNGLILPLSGPLSEETKAAPVPVVFYNANINVDETVYDNILLEDLAGKLSIHETGFVELAETKTTVADGAVTFSLELDPLKNNYVASTLQAKNISANALARALLDASNQVFGRMDGTIQFATEGYTQQEQFDNANGSADFLIEDGRLPAITRIETLLSAANIIRGGVLGLNLNNLFRILSPFEDDYFAALSGSMAIDKGVAHTDDLLSDGKNLDLLIEGTIKLADGYSDLTVYGDMSQNVDGRLGKVGKLSLNSVLKKIPGIGFNPFTKKKKGLLAYIPGVGYVPGLGGAPGQTNRFQVELEGTLDDPDVLQSFKWLP